MQRGSDKCKKCKLMKMKRFISTWNSHRNCLVWVLVTSPGVPAGLNPDICTARHMYGHGIPSGFVSEVVASQSNTERLTVGNMFGYYHVPITLKISGVYFEEAFLPKAQHFFSGSQKSMSHLSSRLYWF